MKVSAQSRPLGVFFLISFLFSWAFWTPAVLSHFGAIHTHFSPTSPLQLLGDFGPTVGALAVAARNRGEVRRLIFSIWQTRFPLRWYAASLFIPIIIIVSAGALRAAVLHVGFYFTLEKIWHPTSLRGGALAGSVAIVAYAMGMFIFAAAEEIGWRGFALPRLIEGLGFLSAALFLGLMHALWHLPLAFTDGNPLSGENFFLFAVSVVLFSLLIGYLWIHTGSVLLAALVSRLGELHVLSPSTGRNYRVPDCVNASFRARDRMFLATGNIQSKPTWN